VVSSLSSVIYFGLIIAGNLESFSELRQQSLKTNIRKEVGCYEPNCIIGLRISSGSVIIQVTLTVPDTVVGGASFPTPQTATTIEAAAVRLVSQSQNAVSSQLGVTVEASVPVTVATGVSVPLIVAPPPPSLPPLQPPVSAATDGTDRAALGVGIGLATAIIVIVSLVTLYCYQRKLRFALRRKPSERGPNAPMRAQNGDAEVTTAVSDSAAAPANATLSPRSFAAYATRAKVEPMVQSATPHSDTDTSTRTGAPQRLPPPAFPSPPGRLVPAARLPPPSFPTPPRLAAPVRAQSGARLRAPVAPPRDPKSPDAPKSSDAPKPPNAKPREQTVTFQI